MYFQPIHFRKGQETFEDACVVSLPVAAVCEGRYDQAWSVAQVLIPVRQTSIDHLSVEVVFLRDGGFS